jgi:hypothetical protein
METDEAVLLFHDEKDQTYDPDVGKCGGNVGFKSNSRLLTGAWRRGIVSGAVFLLPGRRILHYQVLLLVVRFTLTSRVFCSCLLKSGWML